MSDFTQIKHNLKKINELDKLNKYYDEIFCDGVFFIIDDINKIDKLFCYNYELHLNDRYKYHPSGLNEITDSFPENHLIQL